MRAAATPPRIGPTQYTLTQAYRFWMASQYSKQDRKRRKGTNSFLHKSHSEFAPSGLPTCPSLHWNQRNELGSCWGYSEIKNLTHLTFKDNSNLDPVRGMAKRWQVVIDSPMARGAEPCNKY